MVTHCPGDNRIKVQVGWIIQQSELIRGLLQHDPPYVDAARKEVDFLIDTVISQWTAERQEKRVLSKEELLKEFGW